MNRNENRPADGSGKGRQIPTAANNHNMHQSVMKNKKELPTSSELGMCNLPLERALQFARKGYAVFPCKESCDKAKAPYVGGGFKAATTNHRQIVQWWTQWPNALIGLPTGLENGLIVIDLDIRPDGNGLEKFQKILVDHGIPSTGAFR